MAHLVLVRPGFVPAPAHVLPRCTAPEAHTICGGEVERGGQAAVCGGLLGYLLGGWQHVDFCLGCLSEPARLGGCEHGGCPDPEPVTCTHEVDWRCGEPASLTIRCAYAREDQTCCGCCWDDAGSDVPRLVPA